MKVKHNMIVGLQGIIPGGVSVADFSAVTKINSIDSKTILDEFIKNDIGSKQDNFYYFELMIFLLLWIGEILKD